MSWITRTIRSVINIWSPQVTTVRYRYHADKVAAGPKKRLYGYDDPLIFRGTLAHTGGNRRVKSMPLYRPKDLWMRKRALFGQNDYIDILGSDNLDPVKILYNVPSWLRGVAGNEYQVLLRRRKVMKHGVLPVARPSKWKDINKRIKFLYKFLNKKTKTS